MAFDNDKLFVLMQQKERKVELDEILRNLNSERYPLRNKVLKLETELEQAVNREKELSKGGLSNILHRFSGKLEEKREAAHKEASQVKRDFNAATRRLNEIDDGITRAHEELSKIYNCEREYNQALEEKLAAIRESKHPDKQKFLELESKLTLLQNHITELKSAIAAGDSARASASRIISLTDSVNDISVSDVLFRTTFSLLEGTIDRHDRQKEARKTTVVVFEQLDKFKNRLVEVSAYAKDYADISFFSKFFDWLYKLRQDERQFYAEGVVRQVKDIINKLEIVVDIIDNKKKEVKKELENLALQIRL